jgi:hypothetical protein
MGFVTILVQHSWSMQPNASGKAVETPKEEVKTPGTPPKPIKPSDNVRLTDPYSVLDFINIYNTASSLKERQGLETEIRDILDRLTRLVLQSEIPDPIREGSSKKSRIDKAFLESNSDLSINKTRCCAAQARSSLVAFSYCRTRNLREKALDVLIQALNVNYLSHDLVEIEQLLFLLNELKQALELAVDKARSKRSLLSNASVDEDTDNITIDSRVLVDVHLERLLQVF